MKLLICLLISVIAGSGSSVVDFDNQVIPVLTKAGCNTGACHGAAAGRGGFRLSLYGSDPQFDHVSIARERDGRRVNLVQPHASLFLRKPTERLEHGGGYRLDEDGAGAQILQQWITQGARRVPGEKVERLTVTPASVILESVGATVALKAFALRLGKEHDVTEWTVFAPEDDSAIAISSDATLKVLSIGLSISL